MKCPICCDDIHLIKYMKNKKCIHCNKDLKIVGVVKAVLFFVLVMAFIMALFLVTRAFLKINEGYIILIDIAEEIFILLALYLSYRFNVKYETVKQDSTVSGTSDS